jgi:hypothetical protein
LKPVTWKLSPSSADVVVVVEVGMEFMEVNRKACGTFRCIRAAYVRGSVLNRRFAQRAGMTRLGW